jgi:hypothetical protein
MSATLTYEKGDLFTALKAELALKKTSKSSSNLVRYMIPHVCNDQGLWGAGFVLAISKVDPNPESAYKEEFTSGPKPEMLGSFHTVDMSMFNPDDRVTVANMVAQHGVGGVKPLRYAHLGACMVGLGEYLKGRSHHYDWEIWAPKFGSGLAGGSWAVIEELIVETWVHWAEIPVKIFTF